MTFILFICLAFLLLVVYRLQERRHIHKLKAARSLYEKEVEDKIAVNFNLLDVIKDEKRWRGSEAEIVCVRPLIQEDNGFKQELLCHTIKNAWFVAIYHMDQTVVDYVEVCPVDEATVRTWLSSDQEIYARYFAMPETA